MRVVATDIIGTKTRVFSVWVPSSLSGDHTNVTTFADEPGRWYGRVGTERNLPPELAALRPGSDERIEKVRAWQEAAYQRAYDAIIKAHPEAANGRRCMGEISIEVG